MAKGNTIKNFTVGLGFEYDDKGAREIDSNIDSIRGKALQLGAVVAGAFGLKEMTFGFAEANDALGKFSTIMGLDADMVSAFGRALQHEGGSVESFIGQIGNLERMRAGLLTGDAGWIGVAEAAGIDTDAIINATDATDAYLNLADQFANMSRQQRLNAAGALGFDDASIRLLSKGREELSGIVEAEQSRRPVTEAMINEAQRFNDNMQDMLANIGRVADRVSMLLLPAINDTIGTLNEWFETNQGVVDDVINQAPSTAAKYANNLALQGPVGVAGQFALNTFLDSDIGHMITVDAPAAIRATLDEVPRNPENRLPGFIGGRPANPYASPVPIRIENKLQLDGRTIGESVTEVVERIFTDTADEFESPVEG